MTETSMFRIARKRVDEYTSEAEKVMGEHRSAMECCDCQAFLQLGIDAFDWITRADEAIRGAVYAEQMEYTSEIDGIFHALFQNWLAPYKRAEDWVKMQEERGYTVANLDRFRQCREEVEAIVESLGQVAEPKLNPAMSELRDLAVTEHQNGKTAQFMEGE